MRLRRPPEFDQLPALPGSYWLLLELPEALNLQIGRLGSFHFPAGRYGYAGSAHGPGGLRARLRHHAHPAPHPHWHIDYLRPYATLLGCWAACETGGPIPLECLWSQTLARLPGVLIPARGFGAADCTQGCAAHLVYLPAGLTWRPPESFSDRNY